MMLKFGDDSTFDALRIALPFCDVSHCFFDTGLVEEATFESDPFDWDKDPFDVDNK